MGYPQKQLTPDEHVIESMHTHWKALVVPVILLIVTCGVAGFVIALLPSGSAHGPLLIAVLVVAAVIVIWWVLRPFLSWLAASYTLTNLRLVNRTGVFTRRGRDLPLHRVNDVRFERGILDRVLGCGTLIISDASTGGESVFPDVPHVERLQRQVSDLLFRADDGSDDDGTQPPHSVPSRT